MKTDNMMTFIEAAAYLGFANSYMYKLMHLRKIDYLKYGKKAFFTKSACDEFIKKNVRKFNAETCPAI